VEISSHYPYYAAKLELEPEEEPAAQTRASLGAEAAISGEVETGDRIDLVRQQNLASPLQEPVDLTKAGELLRQVQDQMQLLAKQEAQELYQFDRLRDLLYRVAQPEGA